MKTAWGEREVKSQKPGPRPRPRNARKKGKTSRKTKPLSWGRWLRQAFQESTPPDWIPAPYLAMVKRRMAQRRKRSLH